MLILLIQKIKDKKTEFISKNQHQNKFVLLRYDS